jgi:uncharacterized protein DUF2726
VDVALKPFSRRKHLLTKNELSFYEVLRSAMYDYVVFAKVQVADLINANERHRDWEPKFNQIRATNIDFVICDDDSKPVIAIEVDDKSPGQANRGARDADVDRLFQAVGFPLIRLPVQSTYDFEQVRKSVTAELKTAPINEAIWK